MTGRHELEDVVRSWLREDGHEDADRVLFSVLDELDTTPQRHAGWLARRFPTMRHQSIRYGIAAAVVVAAAALGVRLLSPEAGAPIPSTVPSPTALVLSESENPRPLAQGRYSGSIGRNIRQVQFEITIPAGWTAQHVSAGEVSLVGPRGTYPYLGLFSVVRVYRDPCHPETGFQFRPFDLDFSDAHDIAAQLKRMEGFEASEEERVTVGGRDAYHFFLSNSINTRGVECTDGALLPLFATWEAHLSGELVERQHSPATNGRTTLEFWVVETLPYPTVMVAEADPSSLVEMARDEEEIAEMIASLEF